MKTYHCYLCPRTSEKPHKIAQHIDNVHRKPYELALMTTLHSPEEIMMKGAEIIHDHAEGLY